MNKELYDTVIAEIKVQFGAGDYIEPEGREACAEMIVEALEKAGYRKADEVRKETAKEILQHMHDNLPDLKLVVKFYEEKFGIEVDE